MYISWIKLAGCLIGIARPCSGILVKKFGKPLAHGGDDKPGFCVCGVARYHCRYCFQIT